MAMKMKGLLKGLRYISTMFDDVKEEEMQIGLPTDVKHVAHIGYDGPAANNPSWIENFKGGESAGGGEGGRTSTNGDQQTEAKPRSLIGSEQPLLESPSRRRSDKHKGSRRTSSASAVDSPKRLSTSNSAESRNKTEVGDKTSSKPSLRRKKTKSGSSSGQSSSQPSTKSKTTGPPSDTLHDSDPGMGNNKIRPVGTALGADQTTTGRRTKGKDTCQGLVLKISSDQEDQKKSLDDISRGIQAV